MTQKEAKAVEYFDLYQREMQRIGNIKSPFQLQQELIKTINIFRDLFECGYLEGFDEGYKQGFEKGVESWDKNNLTKGDGNNN